MPEPVKGFIDAMLRADLAGPKKQRHFIDRVLQRLPAEHDFEQASYSTVRDYMRRRRPSMSRGSVRPSPTGSPSAAH
ncbi:hypothetical protein [Streptomyces albiflavescens]|uniref:hypothetical protein n=1 Tax=Streptomyces albiflavescens TaxID=1623582 RepID=UPI001667755A